MYRSWSWFNATPLNQHFMHGSVTYQLNIYSFAHQATSVAVNQYSISTDTGSMQHWLLFHWSIYCQISDTLCWCVAKIEVKMILTSSQRRWYCKTGTCHAVVWKVEQRAWNKVSNKLVFGDFLPFFRNILAERTFDTTWTYALFSPFCLIFVFMPTQVGNTFAFFFLFFTDYSTGGRVLCTSWFKSSGKALFFCVCVVL